MTWVRSSKSFLKITVKCFPPFSYRDWFPVRCLFEKVIKCSPQKNFQGQINKIKILSHGAWKKIIFQNFYLDSIDEKFSYSCFSAPPPPQSLWQYLINVKAKNFSFSDEANIRGHLFKMRFGCAFEAAMEEYTRRQTNRF